MLLVCAATSIAIGGRERAALPPQSAANDKIIRRAERAYYHIKVAGLKSIHCEAAPEWDSMVTQLEPPSADRDRILALVKQLHFEVTVGPDGRATIQHSFSGQPPDSKMTARVQNAASSIEQAVNGFFQLWGPFAFGTYFPPPGMAYELENSGGQYLLTLKNGQTESLTRMSRAFEITEMDDTTPQYHVTMRPAFSHGAEGLMLNSVKADVVMGTNHMAMAMTVTYRKFQGVTLPASLDAKVNAGGENSLMQVKFDNYHIER